MPLTRSNTGRSSSRSPLPQSQHSHRSPRPFLPPSHYAAAAGVVYSSKTPVINQLDTVGLGGKDKVDYYTGAFMPVAYPSDIESTSESSLDSKANWPAEDKPPTPAKSNPRGRRQSLLDDLPQLEANLLPSLRDTIDRMTRTPSQPDLPSNAGSASRLGVPKLSGSIRSSRSLSPSYAASTAKAKQSAEQPVSNPTTPINTCQSPNQDQYHSKNFPNAVTAEFSVPTAHNADKSFSKSSLRRPTQNVYSTTHGHDAANDSVLSKPTRSALKNSSTCNVTSSTKSEPGASQKSTTNKNVKLIVSSPRPRSRTFHEFTPGDSFQDQGSTSARQSGRTTAFDARQKNFSQPSSIPQHSSQRTALQSQRSIDAPELDRRYESVERRKLIVANTEAFQSSSESEVERRVKFRGRYNEVESNAKRGNIRVDTQGVGLGIDIDSSTKRHKVNNINLKQEISQVDAQSRHRKSRVHMAALHSPAVEKGFHRDPKNKPEIMGEHQQRRATLLGVINRLRTDNQATNVETESEDDFYEVGVAISGSQDFKGEMVNASSQKIHDDEYGYESGNSEESTFHHRPVRTSSPTRTPQPTSTALLSTNGDAKGRPTLHSDRFLTPSQTPLPMQADKLRDLSSTSRSPVIPQTDTVTIPAVLRRHSVYHRSKSPMPSKPACDVVDKKTSSRVPVPSAVKAAREPSQECRDDVIDRSRRSHDSVGYERKVSGSTPSDVVGIYQDAPRQTLTHADSDLSSVGSVYWDDESEAELSPAAETLFRKLGKGQEKEDRRNHQPTSEKSSFRRSAGSKASSPSYAASDYDIHHGIQSPRHEEHPRSRPLATQSTSIDITSLLEADAQKQRQDLIEEIYQTQEGFVKRLQVFVDLFILPLRVQDSKEWITGIPSEVARLFDWLEDIVVLHRQILTSLESTRAEQKPMVEYIAESIRTFVPRLEVYQPYLIKMKDVIALIDRRMQDGRDDFGEFIRLQETEPECGGWNIQHFLMEPINLLAKFPEYFSKLLELTPKNHRDYISTFSLAQSTNVFIRVMTEVKAREDEYTLVHNFASRIQGLPPSAQLASRDRRLLHHGILLMAAGENHEILRVAGASMGSGHLSEVHGANKVSRVATSANQWDSTRLRSESPRSPVASLNFTKSHACLSPTADSTFFALLRTPIPQGRPNESLTPTFKTPMPPSPALRNNTPYYDISVQAFIFTDLMLLATPNWANDSGDWVLLDHIGIVKIFDVKHDTNGSQDLDVITVDVLPIDADKLNQPMDIETSSLLLLRFMVPRDESNSKFDASLHGETKTSWISAFQCSQKFTLCSLSIPSKDYDPQSDSAFDKQQTVFSLLASGLPLPKSPSTQMTDALCGASNSATVQEREERGWWCLRFQQVFRELQRQEMIASMNNV